MRLKSHFKKKGGKNPGKTVTNSNLSHYTLNVMRGIDIIMLPPHM